MSQINYIYFKTGQGVNFGSCPSLNAFIFTERRLIRRGYKFAIEASTPELRAEQLRKIREQK